MGLIEIEIVSIPVSNQDKAKEFYTQKLGFQVMNDSPMDEKSRWVQLSITPKAATSISLVTWFTEMLPGSAQGMILLTDDIVASRKTLLDAGVKVSDIDQTPWGQFAQFKDPDGNGWSLHQP